MENSAKSPFLGETLFHFMARMTKLDCKFPEMG